MTNILGIECGVSFIINTITGLIAYTLQQKTRLKIARLK
ncbi:hypothetical protein BTN49_2014 [Candidatus Enterovibrio escicola]|uniref:Uncharacterized protein n=1 Tax=Candidatus Enterovibrio escicola TaxID=1927127 RepID=A0A2A5T284_9GAMM|nr:hypothetical protein BTN49_2014 [Candidatus Enterovibrio escacola]